MGRVGGGMTCRLLTPSSAEMAWRTSTGGKWSRAKALSSTSRCDFLMFHRGGFADGTAAWCSICMYCPGAYCGGGICTIAYICTHARISRGVGSQSTRTPGDGRVVGVGVQRLALCSAAQVARRGTRLLLVLRVVDARYEGPRWGMGDDGPRRAQRRLEIHQSARHAPSVRKAAARPEDIDESQRPGSAGAGRRNDIIIADAKPNPSGARGPRSHAGC